MLRACLGDSDITVSWVPTDDQCASFSAYYIYGRIDTLTPFQIIDTVKSIGQNNYTHKGAKTVSTKWQYLIVTYTDCIGDTLISSILNVDETSPPISNIDSISVDPFSGVIWIGWSGNPASDISGYNIIQTLGASNIIVGTTSDTSFQIPSRSVSDSTYSFRVSAFDSCGLQAASPSGHTTMVLKGTMNDCEGKYLLKWSPYIGWSPGVAFYKVFVNRNNTGFVEEIQVSGSETNAELSGFSAGDTVAVFIRALHLNNRFTSSSNLTGITFPLVKRPRFNYLSNTTVVDNNSVLVRWVADTTAAISKFILLHGSDSNILDTLDTIDFISGQHAYSYNHNNKVDVMGVRHFYKVLVLDDCGNYTGSFTAIHSPILLKAGKRNDTSNALQWTPYLNWRNGIGYYYIYRGGEFNGQYKWNLIGSAQPSDTEYVDPSPGDNIGNTGLCYYIEAYENEGNFYTYPEAMVSRSNISCEIQDFTAFFPNAINPYGYNNRTWVPRFTYINFEKSNITIYNRWGQVIKKIEDVRKGWDGKNEKGDFVMPDVYVYIALLQGVNKKKRTENGFIYFVR